MDLRSRVAVPGAPASHVVDEPGMRDALRASDFVPTDEEIARIEREVRDEGL